MKRVEEICPSCGVKQVGYITENNEFVCPSCSPLSIYLRCEEKWKAIEKQEKKKAKAIDRLQPLLPGPPAPKKTTKNVDIKTIVEGWSVILFLIIIFGMPAYFLIKGDKPRNVAEETRCDECGKKSSYLVRGMKGNICRDCKRAEEEEIEEGRRLRHVLKKRGWLHGE